jgi:PadR family transcriptional regulator, regulatory protein PadR
MLELADCPCAGGTLDWLIQPAILMVLAEEPLHGYRIGERLGEMPTFAARKPDISGVYRFLKSMESKQLVTGEWDLSESGPARKCYHLTSTGRRCLQQWIRTLEDYREHITTLLHAARTAVRR